MNSSAAGLRGATIRGGPGDDSRSNGGEQLTVPVLTAALPLGTHPAADDDGYRDDCDNNNCRGSGGKLAHCTLMSENPPAFCLMELDSLSIRISSAACQDDGTP